MDQVDAQNTIEKEDVESEDDDIESADIVIDETEDVLEESHEGAAPPPVAKRARLEELESTIKTLKTLNQTNLDEVLPDPCSVRAAHHNIATHLEGKIAIQMTDADSAFLMPDGTSRQRLGRVGASLVFIEGQVRALKCQLMGNETRENWADTLVHNLKRL